MTDKDSPCLPGYEIEKKLGQGGMASVYLATQSSTGQQVALKIMSSELGDDNIWARRFIKEAQIVAQLSHPNIVPVYDVGTFEGHFYISMETMTGGDLEEKMAEGISISEVLKVIASVAAGLDFAGEKGFVHRDIKPDNVMFRADGTPVILDFGIVKQKNDKDNNMTQTGTIIGTSDYMSPEQAQGYELDERSDIYSLGCMMFKLLTGFPPYEAESPIAVLLKHIKDPPPSLPSSLSALQPLIDKAMAKDVEHRYARASDMIEHLHQLTPQIKELLAQQAVILDSSNDTASDINAAASTNSVTEAITKLSSVASVSKGSPAKATAVKPSAVVTAENEIADVLKDAKATIHHHSAASRNKKTKRIIAIVAFASIVAVLALSYVAYQQVYIAPLEIIRAKQIALENAAKKSKIRTTTLLDHAQEATEKLNYADLKSVDKLIIAYREVLKIDPDNQQAQLALIAIGKQHIELAKKELALNNLDLALVFRNYAERLSPGDKNLLVLRKSITAVQANTARQKMESEFQQRRVETLLAEAMVEASDSSEFSDLAYTKLQQVLQIDENNPQAKVQLESLLTSLFVAAEYDIKKDHLNKAQVKIKQLKKYAFHKNQITKLQSKLDIARAQFITRQQSARSAQKKARLAQKKKDRFTKIERLKRENRTISINEELREIYLALLKVDPANSLALAGLTNTSNYDANLARVAISKRNYTKAQQQINNIQKLAPKYSNIKALQTELQQAQQAEQKADKLLNDAQLLLQSTTEGSQRRQQLKNIYNTLQTVNTIDKSHPQLPTMLASLESTYVSTIQQLIVAEETEQVNAYFNDVTGKQWPTDRLFQLQLANKNVVSEKPPEKKKKRRVLTGGF